MRMLAIVVLVAGCWTSSTTPPPVQPSEPPATQAVPVHAPPPRESSQEEHALQALEGFTERMCACSDSACAVQVSNDMTAWSQDFARNHPEPPPRLDEEQTKRATDIGTRMGECMQRAMTPATPPPSP